MFGRAISGTVTKGQNVHILFTNIHSKAALKINKIIRAILNLGRYSKRSLISLQEILTLRDSPEALPIRKIRSASPLFFDPN
jgi:hypothetical protein